MLTSRFNVKQWDSDEAVPYEELLKNVPGIDALYCLLTDRISSEVLEAAGPSLKALTTMSVGYEHIDLDACKRLGIKVGNTPDVSTETVAELTVALLLATSRRIVEGVHAVKAGEWSTWKPMWLCGQGINNHTVGIVGMGRIGYAVAVRIKAFGPKSIVYSDVCENKFATKIGAKFVSLDELLTSSDFVISICPYNEHTAGLFSKATFAKMKRSAVFVNAGRGGVVNQDDLYDALVAGEIVAAGLDVTEPEPLPTNDKLLTLPNCVILPHIGSATIETRTHMAEIAVRNIVSVLDGQAMPCPVEF